MWTKVANREDLLDLLAGKLHNADAVRETNRLPEKPMRPEELCLIWPSNPRNRVPLPTLIMVPDGGLRDFLAWTTTFIGGYRPFTAYCRVLERGTAHEFERNISPVLGELENACAAIIIAETLTQLGEQTQPNELSIGTCKGSYSYSMSRLLALHVSQKQMDSVSAKWALCRKLTEQSDHKMDFESIKRIWKILWILSGSSDDLFPVSSDKDADILEACTQLRIGGSIRANTWRKLTYGHKELIDIIVSMEGIKEQAVVSLEQNLANLDHYIYDPFLQSFICGYLFSLLSSGSLNHIGLIRTFLGKYPGAMLWYGVCSGLSPRSEILGLFQGLGRRLLRDLLFEDSYLTPPRSDISLDELEVFFKGDVSFDDFKKDSPNKLNVEIAPFISMTVKWPSKKIEPSRTSLPQERASVLLQDLGNAIRRIDEIHRKLISASNIGTERQPSKHGKDKIRKKIEAKKRIQ